MKTIKHSKSQPPRPMSLVRFKRGQYSEDDEKRYYQNVLNRWFIYLGDIPNQPGHCVLIRACNAPTPADQPVINMMPANEIGTFELFRHTADFEEVPEDEV